MRRTSFVGALTVMAIGGVLAFAIRQSPSDLNIQLTGFIIMLSGALTLAIRFMIADSPLLPQGTADIAAVVEPLGEPAMDAFGRPVTSIARSGTNPVPVVLPSGDLPVGAPLTAAQPNPQAVETPTQVLRPYGDHEPADSLTPVRPFTGRRVRVGRRRP